MLIQRPADIAPSEITPRSLFEQRRRLIQAAGALIAGAALGWPDPRGARAAPARALGPLPPGPYSTTETMTPLVSVTRYNNFYEFGSDKADPAQHAGRMAVSPWRVRVEGLVAKPGEIDLEDILKLARASSESDAWVKAKPVKTETIATMSALTSSQIALLFSDLSD